MWMKAGFIVAVLLFGAVMFAAGTMAPPSISARTAEISTAFIQHLPLENLFAPKNASASEAAKSAVSDTEVPIAYTALDLPDALPENGKYALEVDMVLNESAAKTWIAQLQAQQYSTHEIAVIGPDGSRWIVIAAGNFKTPQAARDARPNLLQDITQASKSSLRVIMLPSAKEKS